MRSPLVAAVLAGVLVGPLVTTARADISVEEVREAIDKGVAFLKRQQEAKGGWSEYITQPGGKTALATLALLEAGVPPTDEHIQRALKFLRQRRPQSTYVVALQTMVFCRATPANDMIAIDRNVKWLENNQIKSERRRGAWSYPSGAGDGSNAQFALLALYEAERVGVRVRPETWRLAKEYWENNGNPDGSWGYYLGLEGTGSMTCAGIASLVICADMAQQADAKADGNEIKCCGQGDVPNDRIEQGIRWLADHFNVQGNPPGHSRNWNLYYLYGLERVGRMTARRFIGEHDWYREGAEHLLRIKGPLADSWTGIGFAEDDPVVATSLALLFLSKGRRPVLVAKLKHGPGLDWTQHRSDIHNLTLYVESRWKRDLNWQVMDLAAASADDLGAAPVLFLCGNQSPLPPTEAAQQALAQKLRDYIDRGGFLFAEAYCGGEGFDQGFRELMRLVFPDPEYRLKLLPPEHPVWRAEEKVPDGQWRRLEGIEFGCRTSVVYAPVDPKKPRPSLSCLWELSRSGRSQTFTPAVQTQINGARAIGINVLAYATNRELKYNPPGVQHAAKEPPKPPRGTLLVAKLRHPGGCDAAPRALVNLMQAAGRELKVPTAVRPTLVNFTDEALFNYHLVFMHGRNGFVLTKLERERLRTYIERGGMLFADSICAAPEFSKAFRREMAAIFPKQPLEDIPAVDPIWTTKFGGFDLSTVRRRDPQPAGRDGRSEAIVRKVAPSLQGIKMDDRWAVIFSEFDLSCALEKQDSLECRGYVREDAARLGLNVLLYSVQK